MTAWWGWVLLVVVASLVGWGGLLLGFRWGYLAGVKDCTRIVRQQAARAGD